MSESSLAEAGAPAARGGNPAAVAAALQAGVRVVAREQLPGGEMPTYFRSGANLEYRRSPLVSCYVHDALARFDAMSFWFAADVLDAIPRAALAAWVRQAKTVRSRIRRFLAQEELANGSWRFWGRQSPERIDLDTSACGAAVFLDVRGRRLPARLERYAALLLDAAHDLHNEPLRVRANAVRFLALAGLPTEGITEQILADLDKGPALTEAAADGTHPLLAAYCLARAWRQGGFPAHDQLSAQVIPQVAAFRRADGRPHDALDAALGLSVFADLDYSGPESAAARQLLLNQMDPRRGWRYAPAFLQQGGAGALTSAIAINALSRTESLA